MASKSRTLAELLAGQSSTDSIDIPVGTTAQRPSSPTSGNMRYNTTTNSLEIYNGSAWEGTGGATGASGEKIIYENEKQIDNSYTIATNFNAMTAGPVVLADGASVTIQTGSAWTIVGE